MIWLKIDKIEESDIIFFIKEQSTFYENIGEEEGKIGEYGNGLKCFVAENGIRIGSYAFPQFIRGFANRLMIQGVDASRNHEKIRVDYKKYLEIYEAVNEYNQLEEEKFHNIFHN